MSFDSAVVTSASYTAGYPILAANTGRYDATLAWKWNDGGTWADDDETDSSYPTTRLGDGFVHLPSRAAAAKQALYLVGQFNADVNVDFVFIHLNYATLHASTNLTFEFCDDSDGVFTPATLVTTITEASFVAAAKKRCLFAELHHGADAAGVQRRYSGVRYFRIMFDAGGGNTHKPEVNEVWLGTQCQLGCAPLYPFDDFAYESSVERFVSDSGLITNYKRFSGKRSLKANLLSLTSTDNTALEAFCADIDYGNRPFLWLQVATAASNTPCLMVMDDPRSFDFPQEEYGVRKLDLDAIEQGGSMLVNE